MPTYSSAYPPLSLFPGDVGFSFNNEAVPAAALAGSQFALTFPSGFSNSGKTVRWQTLFTVAPTAIDVSLQAALADVDAEYKDIDNSAVAAGEAKTVTGVQARFLRIKVNTVTVGAGAGFTAKMLV